MRVEIKSAHAFEGPAYHYTAQDDGQPAGAIVPVLIAYGKDGTLYQLPNSIKVCYDEDGFQFVKFGFTLSKAREIEGAIYDRGFINAENWVIVSEDEMKEYLCGAYGYAYDGSNA